MNKKISTIIFKVARLLEILFSIIISCITVIMFISLIYGFLKEPFLEANTDQFMNFLANILTLLIGVEFIKMLAKHTAENYLEVLVFAIIRQIVVGHKNMFEVFIGVFAIGLLFAIRKFLLCEDRNEAEDSPEGK
ncbi:MAG: phosphate-starvation-inducible PsiE family protein [Erysipelotrichaceae bacterium]|nr:phosphate-starvation-inducible PsiE family protein [Erysipelotrichaceae bacterium]